VQIAFAEPLILPTWGVALFAVNPDSVVAFPHYGRPRARHSGDQRFRSLPIMVISFVTYSPLQELSNIAKMVTPK